MRVSFFQKLKRAQNGWRKELGEKGWKSDAINQRRAGGLSHKTLGRSLNFIPQAGSHGRILIRGALDGQKSCFLPVPLYKDPYNEAHGMSYLPTNQRRVRVPLKPDQTQHLRQCLWNLLSKSMLRERKCQPFCCPERGRTLPGHFQTKASWFEFAVPTPNQVGTMRLLAS